MSLGKKKTLSGFNIIIFFILYLFVFLFFTIFYKFCFIQDWNKNKFNKNQITSTCFDLSGTPIACMGFLLKFSFRPHFKHMQVVLTSDSKIHTYTCEICVTGFEFLLALRWTSNLSRSHKAGISSRSVEEDAGIGCMQLLHVVWINLCIFEIWLQTFYKLNKLILIILINNIESMCKPTKTSHFWDA